MLYLLNASIVGLCVDRTEYAAAAQPYPLQIVDRVPVCTCVGLGMSSLVRVPQCVLISPVLGIVRAVDVAQRLLFVVTPVSAQLLPRVNLLVRGALELPSLLLLQVRLKHRYSDIRWLKCVL